MNIDRNLIKKILPMIGNLLVIFSFYYLAVAFHQNFNRIELNFTTYTILILVICLLFNILSYMILAYAWFLQVHHSHPILTFKKSIAFVGLSQIAKYLPGNIGHILTRGILLKKYMKTKDITLSFIIEFLCITIVFGFFSLLHLQYIKNTNFSQYVSFWYFLLILFSGLIVLPWIYKIIQQKFDLYDISINVIIKIFFLFSLVSLSSGVSLLLLSSLYQNVPYISFWQYTSGFAFAFIVGFIMPGAPAGIGIREALFVILFGADLGEQVAMEIILIIRLISLVADIALFVIVYSVKSRLLS